MPAKLLNLLAVSSLAILACSFGATPATALSLDQSHILPRHHAVLANMKRGPTGKRCKPRTPPASSPQAPPQVSSQPPKATVSVPPPPKTSSSPPPPPPPQTGGSGGKGKGGIAWANADDNALARVVSGSSKASTVYTWNPYKPPVVDKLGLEFCSMLWGPKQLGQFQQLVKPGYAHCVMGFNEPDQDGQSNLDPGYAAQLWKQYIQPLKQHGYFLVSPACTNAPKGLEWMKRFMAACTGCTFDAVATHFYGTNPDNMIAHLNTIHNTFGRQVWVTEFACQNFSGGAQCTQDQVWHFMKTVKAFMDSTSWMGKYFPFGYLTNMGNVNAANRLITSSYQRTDLGGLFLN